MNTMARCYDDASVIVKTGNCDGEATIIKLRSYTTISYQAIVPLCFHHQAIVHFRIIPSKFPHHSHIIEVSTS